MMQLSWTENHSYTVLLQYEFCYFIISGSKPHKELADVIERPLLIKDIKKLSPAERTYGLESFHKICCYFATKFVHFFYLSMDGR